MSGNIVYGTAINELTFAEKPVAGIVDWKDLTTAFNKANEIFTCLCTIDNEFTTFADDLFNQESVRTSLAMATKAKKAEIDSRIGKFLTLLSPHLVMPNVIVIIDWLIRRYYIHAQNVNDFIRALLPHHNEKFAIKLMQLLDWRFIDKLKWGWLKHFTDKGQPIPNSAFAKICSKDVNLLNNILFTAIEHVEQNEERLAPFVALYVNTMVNIFDFPLGPKKFSTILQPALDLIDLGLKRTACPCFASAIRIVILRASRAIILNSELVVKWIKMILRTGKYNLRGNKNAPTDETVLLVKSLCLAQNITLTDKLQSRLAKLENHLSADASSLLTPSANVSMESVKLESSSLLNDLAENSSSDKKQSEVSVVQSLKEKLKKKRVSAPLKTDELNGIFVGENHYEAEQIEAVLIRFLHAKELHNWAVAPKFLDLLSRVLDKHKSSIDFRRQRSSNSVCSDLVNKTNLSIMEVDATEDEEEEDSSMIIVQRSPLLSLISQVLLCIQALLNHQLSSSSSSSSSKAIASSFVNVDVEPIFRCLTVVKETAVHRLVLQVVTQLAKILPSALVHDMMPVVTHMSNGVLPLDDEDSLNLIGELVSVAIPAYLEACAQQSVELNKNRKSKEKEKKRAKMVSYPVQAILSVLSCLVPSWSTIPAHRRQIFYVQLVHCVNKAVGFSPLTTTGLNNQSSILVDKSLHRDVLWVVVTLFFKQMLTIKSDQQGKLFNFLSSFILSYNSIRQLQMFSNIYQFLAHFYQSVSSSSETQQQQQNNNDDNNKEVHSLWAALVTLIGRSSYPSLVILVASLHEKLIVSAQWREIWRQNELRLENVRHDDNNQNLLFMLTLRDLVNHLMNTWLSSQSKPESKQWKQAADQMHQLVLKLNDNLPLDCYVNILIGIVSVGGPSPANASLQSQWPFLQKKAFELLHTKLKSTNISKIRSELTIVNEAQQIISIARVQLNCLIRLKDVLLMTSTTTVSSNGVGSSGKNNSIPAIELRCHTLLCIKELVKCLLDNKDCDKHSQGDPVLVKILTDSKNIFVEIAVHISQLLSQKKLPTTKSVDVTQNELSLCQVLIASLLPHLPNELMTYVPQYLLSCASFLQTLDLSCLDLDGKSDSSITWSEEVWQQIFSSLLLTHALLTTDQSLLTETLDEWTRGRLNFTLEIYFIIAVSIQRNSLTVDLTESCAILARQCMKKLLQIRNALAAASPSSGLLLKLLKDAKYPVARGTLSIVRRYCDHVGKLRSQSDGLMDSVWEMDVNLIPLALCCLESCDICLTLPSSQRTLDLDVSDEEDDDPSFNPFCHEPLWKEIKKAIVAMLQMPSDNENEDRILLLMRLLAHAKLTGLNQRQRKFRMRMILEAISQFVPLTSAENGEELLGRTGLSAEMDF